MKKIGTIRLLFLLSFGMTVINCVYGQNTKQTYNGKFKHIYSDGIVRYQYFENEQGEWIPDGFFQFDEAFGNYKIKGQYIDGRKSGNWVYSTKSTTITYSFNNGLLNGQWKSVYNNMTRSESIIANFDNGRLVGKFSIDKIADDWGWDAKVTGQFNDNGFLDGLWVVKYGQKIPREAKFIFKHGVLMNYFDRDLSTGELEKHSNVTYPYCNFYSTDNDTIIKSSVFWDNFNNYDGTSFVVNNSGDTIYYERVDNERCGDQLSPSNIIAKIIFENMSKKAHIFSKNGSIIDDRESPSFSIKISGIIEKRIAKRK
jgi:hypothetical protein